MSWKPREAEHFSRWDLTIKRRLRCIWPFYVYPSSVQKAVGIDSLRSPVALRDFSVRVVTKAKVVHEDFTHSKKKMTIKNKMEVAFLSHPQTASIQQFQLLKPHLETLKCADLYVIGNILWLTYLLVKLFKY